VPLAGHLQSCSQPWPRTRGSDPPQVERSHARRPAPCRVATPSPGTHATPPPCAPAGAARAAASARACQGRTRSRLRMWLPGQRGKSKPAPVRARLWAHLPLANPPDQPYQDSGVGGVRCRSSTAMGSRRGREPKMGCSISRLNALYDAATGGGDVWINERASTSSARSVRAASASSTRQGVPTCLRCRARQV